MTIAQEGSKSRKLLKYWNNGRFIDETLQQKPRSALFESMKNKIYIFIGDSLPYIQIKLYTDTINKQIPTRKLQCSWPVFHEIHMPKLRLDDAFFLKGGNHKYYRGYGQK